MQYDSSVDSHFPVKKCQRDKQTLYYIAFTGYAWLAGLWSLFRACTGYYLERSRGGSRLPAFVCKAEVRKVGEILFDDSGSGGPGGIMDKRLESEVLICR